MAALNPFDDLVEAFTRLGIGAGDRLLVHASLRSVGSFPRRAERITEALRSVLGPEGVLLMPALSYETVTPERPFFSQSDTPSCVGGLTEYFRQRPDTHRSLHPTHSVCGLGEQALPLLRHHHLDHTPVGPRSPFRMLREAEGKILFLGCGPRPNTSMHGIEELAPPPYLFGPSVEYTIRTAAGRTYQKAYITHHFAGVEQRYDRVLEVLGPDDFRRGKVLDAEAILMRCEPLWNKAHAVLRDRPFFFVDEKERSG